MSHLNNCDCCNIQKPSIDLFWNIYWKNHTARELTVIETMNRDGLDAICFDCFNTLIKAA